MSAAKFSFRCGKALSERKSAAMSTDAFNKLTEKSIMAARPAPKAEPLALCFPGIEP